MIALKPDALRGAYTPLITPFLGGAVDHASYAALIEHQIAEGVDGLVVAGTSGEPFSLTREEREALLETALKTAAGRVPVIAATGSFSLAETLALTRHAEQAGADAVLVLTPPFAKPPQRSLAEYFIAIGQATALPLLLYQIPSRTQCTASLETCAAIAAAVPSFVGMKQSDDDRAFVHDALARFGKEFRIFMGLSAIAWDMIPKGACGLIVALANALPRRIGDIVRLARADDPVNAAHEHQRIAALNQAAFLETNPIGVKYMAWRLGLIATPEHRLPLAPPLPAVREMLDAALRDAGLL